MSKWNKEDIEILKEHYPKMGKNVADLLTTKRTYTAIRHKASRLDIIFDGVVSFAERIPELSVECWEKYYFLGIAYTDGSVSYGTGNGIQYRHQCATRDVDLLYWFQECLGFGKVSKIKNRECYGTTRAIHPDDLEILKEYGIVKNKTYRSKEYPVDCIKRIPDEYFLDFLRGVIDGDGTVGINNGRCQVVITGSLIFLSALKDRLDASGDYCGKLRPNGKDRDININAVLGIKSAFVKTFFHLLYEEAKSPMKRKLRAYNEWKDSK